jgi:hypothetical protein
LHAQENWQRERPGALAQVLMETQKLRAPHRLPPPREGAGEDAAESGAGSSLDLRKIRDLRQRFA